MREAEEPAGGSGTHGPEDPVDTGGGPASVA